MLKTGTEKKIALDAAIFIADHVFSAIEHRGFSSLVLAGGNSPRILYSLLSGGIPRNATSTIHLPWQSVMLFWGDERCVPENHADSNYRMAQESLIASADIPEHNIFPMPHVTGNHDAAALFYEKELRKFFEKQKQGIRNSFPVFDLIILGMGTDGHTSSLFPDDKDALEESERWVLPVHAPQGSPPGYRLTLTLPVINNANNVVFFVTGKQKEKMVLDITSGRRSDLPAALVKPEYGELVWFYGKD